MDDVDSSLGSAPPPSALTGIGARAAGLVSEQSVADVKSNARGVTAPSIAARVEGRAESGGGGD